MEFYLVKQILSISENDTNSINQPFTKQESLLKNTSWKFPVFCFVICTYRIRTDIHRVLHWKTVT